MNLFKLNFPTVHFTTEDLKPLTEESKQIKQEGKSKNNCTIDYLNELGFVAFREEYNVKDTHEARQKALFRKRIHEANKIKVTGAYITFNNVQTFEKF